MKTKHYLSLTDAEFLLTQAHEYSISQNLNVSIAVVDDAGILMTMKRMDLALPMTANLAVEKAKCSALSRNPSKLFEDLIKAGHIGFVTMESFSGMLEGGEPIIYQGHVVGAVGVSGATASEDAQIAKIAIEKFLVQV